MPETDPRVEALATALAETIHDAMCDVSHHDRPPARCSRWAKYPQIALFVAPRLLAALPPCGHEDEIARLTKALDRVLSDEPVLDPPHAGMGWYSEGWNRCARDVRAALAGGSE